MTGRQRKVIESHWNSAPRFSRGFVAGTNSRWLLKLSCGHTVVRYGHPHDRKAPTKALCKECLDP